MPIMNVLHKVVSSDFNAFRDFAVNFGVTRLGLKRNTIKTTLYRIRNFADNTGKQARSGLNTKWLYEILAYFLYEMDVEITIDFLEPDMTIDRGFFPNIEMAKQRQQELLRAGVPRARIVPTKWCYQVTASS